MRANAGSGRVLATAALGAGLAFVDATIVNVAFPDLGRDFPDASLDELSWVLNAYNIVFAAFLVPAGRIADLLGRRLMFNAGVLLFTLASVLCALAPSVVLLIAARVLQALGAAMVVPSSLAIVLHAYPGAERTRGVAMWSASAALAAGLGPSIGGVLVEIESWRLAFLVNLPIGLAAWLQARRTLVESRAPGRRRLPDLFGAGLLAAATALLTLAIVRGEDWGWTAPPTLTSAALAVALGAAFIRRCARHREPLIDLGLLKVRSISVSNALTVLGAAGFYAYVLCNVLFLTGVWRYSVLEAGLALTPGPLVAAAVARPAGRLADRAGMGPMLALGGLIWAAGVVLLVRWVGPEPDLLGRWLPIMAVLGVGAGIVFPVVGAAAVAVVPGGRFATATGLNSIARQLGAVLGVALLVAIVGVPSPADAAAALDRGWTFAAACFALLALLAPALGRLRSAQAEARRTGVHPALPVHRVPERLQPVAALRSLPTAARPTPQALLARAPLFAGLPERTRMEILRRSALRYVPCGATLFRAGDPSDALYLIAGGRIELSDGNGSTALLGPGAVLGERALIDGGCHATSARARRDSELIEVGAERFDRLLDEEPGFARAMLRAVSDRPARAAPANVPPATVVAVLPLDAGAPVDQVAFGLAYAWQRHDRVARVDPGSELARDPDVALVERLKRDHDRVLLVGAPPGSDERWTAYCARQADRVLLLAGTDAPRAHELEGADLLLPGGSSDALAAWRAALRPRRTYVLERGEELLTGVERAARRIAGRSPGLVLSGGGARAFAHLGAIEELARAGVAIDRVGGVSMGAYIGALTAAGLPPEQIDAVCYDGWVRRNPLRDLRPSRTSLLRGDKVNRLLARTLPWTIEELARDYFCLSCDLLSGDPVVHRAGPLAAAVGPSLCIPGLAPPVARDGRLLVDGGVVNNLPVDVMAAAGEGPIVAVDVTNRAPLTADRPPALSETLHRVLEIGSADTAELARRHATLTIVPRDDGVGLLEFHQLDAAKEAGRRAAHEALSALPPGLLS